MGPYISICNVLRKSHLPHPAPSATFIDGPIRNLCHFTEWVHIGFPKLLDKIAHGLFQVHWQFSVSLCGYSSLLVHVAHSLAQKWMCFLHIQTLIKLFPVFQSEFEYFLLLQLWFPVAGKYVMNVSHWLVMCVIVTLSASQSYKIKHLLFTRDSFTLATTSSIANVISSSSAVFVCLVFWCLQLVDNSSWPLHLLLGGSPTSSWQSILRCPFSFIVCT